MSVEYILPMLSIRLPAMGTDEDPVACMGSRHFDDPRTKAKQARCKAICDGCSWLGACRQTAQLLLGQGEKLWGVWGGQCYGIDNDPVTPVTIQRNARDTPASQPAVKEARHYAQGGKGEARGSVDVASGRHQEGVDPHPTRVVRIVGSRGPSSGGRSPRAVPHALPGRLTVTPSRGGLG